MLDQRERHQRRPTSTNKCSNASPVQQGSLASRWGGELIQESRVQPHRRSAKMGNADLVARGISSAVPPSHRTAHRGTTCAKEI